jgi:hypothetical protein
MPDDVQSNAGSVEFIEYHQPGLTDGDYEITVTQEVSTPDLKIPDAEFTTTKNFTVAGERFELKPSDVHSIFPPDGNLGEHSNVLPHIILNRSTLPWERRAEDESNDVPWLALLLFDEAEKPLPLPARLTLVEKSQPTIKTLNQSRDPAPAGKFPELIARGVTALSAAPPFLVLENGQHDGDMLTVIDVKKSLLKAIMPTVEELRLLAHVRLGKDPKRDPTGENLEESAVVISNRLPQTGKSNTVHWFP